MEEGVSEEGGRERKREEEEEGESWERADG